MNNHDQKSTSLYRGPCDRGAVVSWESTSVAAPKGQKGLLARAFYESRCTGPATQQFLPHSRGHRLLQLLHLLPLLLAGRAHHQDGAVAGDQGLDVKGRGPPYESPRLILSIYISRRRSSGAVARPPAVRSSMPICVRDYTRR